MHRTQHIAVGVCHKRLCHCERFREGGVWAAAPWQPKQVVFDKMRQRQSHVGNPVIRERCERWKQPRSHNLHRQLAHERTHDGNTMCPRVAGWHAQHTEHRVDQTDYRLCERLGRERWLFAVGARGARRATARFVTNRVCPRRRRSTDGIAGPYGVGKRLAKLADLRDCGGAHLGH